MKISIVAAMDDKNGIGKGNDLLFRISEDFERMKKLTLGHPIVMGRKTFESIGRVLPGRTNIIVTKNQDFQPPTPAKTSAGRQNCVVAHSLEKGIELAKKSPGAEEIFIFGGGQIFKEALEKNLVDTLYLTLVEGDFDADTFFPDYSEFTHKILEEERESGKYKYKFLTLGK